MNLNRMAVFLIWSCMIWGVTGLLPGQDQLFSHFKEDLNGDGTIDVADLTLLVCRRAGVMSTLLRAGDLYAIDPVAGVLRYVPAGTFIQGRAAVSPPELQDPCEIGNEAPFTHTLTASLAVMSGEVTRRMWASLRSSQSGLPADPSDVTVSHSLEHPVQRLSWRLAVLFANLLSADRGLQPCYYEDPACHIPVNPANYTTSDVYCRWDASGYRLPAEGEWEYFCRAGTRTAFSVDEDNYESCQDYCELGDLEYLEQVAWFCANSTSARTHPAKRKDPNPWGLLDVHGNVSEWCWDWWEDYPSGNRTDYRGPAAGTIRVTRGGGSISGARFCRSAFRGGLNPDLTDAYTGFRLVRRVQQEIEIKGDLNRDGAVNAADVARLADGLSGNRQLFLEDGDYIGADPVAGGLRLVALNPFRQGRGDGDPCVNSQEDPFTNSIVGYLEVMETEVTRRMWTSLRASWNPSPLPADPSDPAVSPGMDHPVQNVSWQEAVLFANLLSESSGLEYCYFRDPAFEWPITPGNYTTGPFYCDYEADGFRLPAEAEWEYFCRAGTTGPFSVAEPAFTTCLWDYTPGLLPGLESVAWFCANGGGTAHPAGLKKPNPAMLRDIHGNVSEWCWDWFGDYPESPQVNYRGPDSGSSRVFRGGDFTTCASYCRSAARMMSSPASRANYLGIRLVRKIHGQ